jgi:hypothetical protein
MMNDEGRTSERGDSGRNGDGGSSGDDGCIYISREKQIN